VACSDKLVPHVRVTLVITSLIGCSFLDGRSGRYDGPLVAGCFERGASFPLARRRFVKR